MFKTAVVNQTEVENLKLLYIQSRSQLPMNMVAYWVRALVRFLQLQIPRSNLCFHLMSQMLSKEVNLILKQPVIWSICVSL